MCATHGRPCGGHEAPFCAHPGGAMEKKGFHAARNAARAAATARDTKRKGSTSAKVYMQLTGPKGKVYLVEEDDLGKLQVLSDDTTPAGFAGLATDDVSTITTIDDVEWEGWMAVDEGEEETTVDWTKFSSTTTTDKALGSTFAATTIDHPFFIDSGATVHISPCRSDFTTFQSINPKAIKGVGGSTISACGIGNIEL